MVSARTWRIEAIPQALMAEPLDWFFAEHHRHRQACRLIASLADDPAFDGACVTEVLEFIRNDLALHIIDEEEDLFPLLRRRALPEDQIEIALGRLSSEHRVDSALAQRVRTILQDSLDRREPCARDASARQALLDFAAQELRHLALENAVVLPIARLRLTQEDIESMAARLAARRGVTQERTRG